MFADCLNREAADVTDLSRISRNRIRREVKRTRQHGTPSQLDAAEPESDTSPARVRQFLSTNNARGEVCEKFS